MAHIIKRIHDEGKNGRTSMNVVRMKFGWSLAEPGRSDIRTFVDYYHEFN